MTQRVLVFHHNDADGRMAAAIVRNIHNFNVELIECKYNSTKWEDFVEPEDKVYVVDFSFPNMLELNEACQDLVWIDHHKSAMETQSEAWSNMQIYGIRDCSLSGAYLAWIHFNGQQEPPESVILVDDYDRWQFKFGNKTRRFAKCLSIMHMDVKRDPLILGFWNDLLVKPEMIDTVIHKGTIMLEYSDAICKQIYDATSTFKKFEGYSVCFINVGAPSLISDVCEYVKQQDDVDIVFAWSIKNDIVFCSLRSKTVDVSEIAKRYGGGGHKCAAGFTMPSSNFTLR